jgi:hypothetical protein
MNVLTVTGTGVVGPAGQPYAIRGFLLTNTAAGVATIQNGAGKELAQIQCPATSSAPVMFTSPLHALGINVTALTGNLNIYVE